MATTKDTANELRERPLGEVAKDLTTDLSLLVRQEIELAKAEMAAKGRTVAPGLGMLGGAGVLGLCAAGALTAFLVLALATFLPDWLAAPVLGGVRAAAARGRGPPPRGVAVRPGGEGKGPRRPRRPAGTRTDHRDDEGGRGMG